MTDPIIIEHDGRPTHVILSWDAWMRLREAAEEAEDLAAVRRVEQDANQDRIPLEAAKRLWAGERPLRVWRELRGLSQGELAERSGIAQPTIAHLESGRRKGTVAQLEALARALDLSLDTLSEGGGEP